MQWCYFILSCFRAWMATRAIGACDPTTLWQINALFCFGNGEMKHCIVKASFIDRFIHLSLTWRFGNREVKQALRLALGWERFGAEREEGVPRRAARGVAPAGRGVVRVRMRIWFWSFILGQHIHRRLVLQTDDKNNVAKMYYVVVWTCVKFVSEDWYANT
jgi:hypothetical protein